MYSIRRMLQTLKIRFALSDSRRAKYLLQSYVSDGMIVGDNTHFFSTVRIGEPYLVSIGSNSTVAGGVCFLTHDASIGTQVDRQMYSDLCGRITIGNNCFIGYGSIILYGVSIPDHVIVAAGSVVTKTIKESRVIIGGNPAHVIGTIDSFEEKYNSNFLSLHGKDYMTKKSTVLDSHKLVER